MIHFDFCSHKRAHIILLGTIIAGALVNCSSDKNTTPSSVVLGGTGGADGVATATGGSDGTVGGDASSGGTTADTAGSTSQGGAGTVGGSSGNSSNDAGLDSGGCDPTPGLNGCYPCPPKTDIQFLNQCTTSQWAQFDNVARLPLYNNGNLPSLP